MSGSETGAAVMTTTEPFTIGVASPPATQTMRVAYGADGTAVYKSVAGSSPTYQSAASGGGGGAPEVPSAGTNVPYGLNMNVGEPVKKKRGRPRKYGADGTMSLALMPARPAAASPAASAAPQSAGTFSPPSGTPPSGAPPSAFAGGTGSASSLKKARGRPPGSSKKQQMEALGSAGFGFTPHVINVKAGEDVSSKIMSFSQNGPRAICILSANGAISNVTLRQAATSGGTATYEGRFEILSLCGSFLLTEVAGQRSRTGGLSVSLAGPDGRVLGGCVAGFLTAASPVQVIVGSFIPEGRKESKPVNHTEPLSSTPMLFSGGGAPVVSSPPSHGTLSESSGGGGSPLNHSTGACNNNNPQGGMLGMPWR